MESLERILPTDQHTLSVKLAAIANDIKKIYNFDLREMRDLSDKYSELKNTLFQNKISEEDLAQIKHIMKEEHKKHRFENHLAELEKELNGHINKLKEIIEQLTEATANSKIDVAAKLAENGAAEAQHGLHLEEKMVHLERKMDVWTKRIIHELDRLKPVQTR